MIVLGLDPGSRFTGYGLLHVDGTRLRAVDLGRIALPASLSLPERLALLVVELEALLDRHAPVVAAVERPFHGVSSSSLIVLAQARGALLATVARRGIAVREYAPAEVKSALGSGRADKSQVARMVGLLLGIDVATVPSDATDALAVALCYAQRRRAETLAASASKSTLGRPSRALTDRIKHAKVRPLRP